MDWQVLASFAVPILGFLGALSTSNRDPGSYRRLKHATEALAGAPESSAARGALDSLVAEQAHGLLERERLRNGRRLNAFNLVMSLILAAFGALASFWLWNWNAYVWGTGWMWLSIPTSVLAGLALALLVGAAFTTIFAPKSEGRRKRSSDASDASE